MINGLMLRGVWATIWLSIVSMIIGLGLGVLAALMKMYGNRGVLSIPEILMSLFPGKPIFIKIDYI